MNGAPRHLVAVALPAALVVYAAIALFQRWWVAVGAAPLVALLLWIRHPRARFSAYVFFTVAAARGLGRGLWPLALFAGTAILVLQTPGACRTWPRLGRRGPRDDDDKMARP
jgi:hypothetical protein